MVVRLAEVFGDPSQYSITTYSFCTLWRWPFKAKLLFHLPRGLFRLVPVKPWPYGTACRQAHAVPDDVEVLPPVSDVLNNDALVIMGLVAILFFAPRDDFKHLFVR